MPNTPISSGLQDFAKEAQGIVANSGASNTNSPFIINPGTGQFGSNPGFLNQLQQFDLYLQQNPDVAAQLQAEESNAQQRQTVIPTADLQNYRNSAGQAAPYGTTYGNAASLGYVPMTSTQQQQNLGIQTAENAIQSAQGAQSAVSPGSVLIGDLLSHISPALGNLVPGYSAYKQSIGALQQNPVAAQAAPIFGNSGVAPQGSALPTLLSNLGVIQQGNNALNPPTVSAPVSNAALQPLPSALSSPYDSTANSVTVPNPAQLGANARATQNIP